MGWSMRLVAKLPTFFTALDDNLFYSGIHQSVGATCGTITGKLLAHLALGQDSKSLSDMLHISEQPATNPPEHFLSAGLKHD